MKWNTSVGLKVMAVVLWYYVLVFFLTVTGLTHFGLRGEYRWDFEAMFASIYAVWGWYLWKTAKNPKGHDIFIDFTIWANIAHGVVMVILGALRNGEFVHMLIDGLVLIVPVSLIYILKKRDS